MLKIPNIYINSIAFSPDGKKIVSGGKDCTVRLWDLVDGTSKIVGRHDNWIYSVAFSPDGKKIVSGGRDNTVRLWDLAHTSGNELMDGASVATDSSQIIGRHDDNTVCSVAFSPDGKKIASGGYDNTVRLWELDGTGKIIGRHDGCVHSVAFSPDNKKIVSGGYEGIVRLWDLTDGTSKIIGRHENYVYSVAFSPDGKKIVSGGRDDTVRLWDLARSARAYELTHMSGNELMDGASVATDSLRSIKIVGRHDNSVYSVAFSPDGKKIVSGGDDRTVLLWDLTNGKNQIIEINDDAVYCVVFSPDGKKIASGGWDRIRIRINPFWIKDIKKSLL